MRLIFILSTSILVSFTGCAQPPKEIPEKEKPLFVILPSERQEVNESENFPERLAGAIKSSRAGRVIHMPTHKDMDIKEQIGETRELLDRLQRSGFKRVYVIGFKKGSVVGCRLLTRYPFLRGYVGIDMPNEYLGGGCLSHLKKRGPVRVLDIYTQRFEKQFREANVRTQFLYKNYDQEMAFGTNGDYTKGENRVYKSIEKWMR